MGASCLNPFTLHPVEIAGQVAALDAESGGRAYLGLAAGGWLDRLGLDTSRPLTAIRETWEIVRRLLARDDTGFTGELFSLAPGNTLAYEPARAAVPLLVGTWSPRLTAFAAGARRGAEARRLREPGDGALDARATRRAHDGWSSGRSRWSTRTQPLRARRRRRELALYLPVVGGLDPTVEIDPNMAQDEIPDDVLDLFSFAGEPAQIVEHAERLFEAGADRVEFGTPHGIDERAGVELLGSQVVPALRRARAWSRWSGQP